MSEEPTVLDFFKALLKGRILEVPPAPGEENVELPMAEIQPQALVEAPTVSAEDEVAVSPAPLPEAGDVSVQPESSVAPLPSAAVPAVPPSPPPEPLRLSRFPWLGLAALGLGLFAQTTLEAQAVLPEKHWQLGVGMYLLAVVALAISTFRNEWLPSAPPPEERRPDSRRVFLPALAAGLVLAAVAFAYMGGNRFTTFNLSVWIVAIGAVVVAFWEFAPGQGLKPAWERLRQKITPPSWNVVFTPWTLLVIAAILLVIFFRVYRIGGVPAEMVSDHAEKLEDVQDVLNGQYSIFFPRNTGREAIQMYLTAAIAAYLGTGLSFISLKIGTVLAGLLTLPYIYLLGNELGNRRAGLLAMVMAGIAYWPNVISRVGLRFPLYPLFVAPVLFYLLCGLRTSNRNDFILSGLALGIGLHGYTPIRILPLVVVAAVGLYVLHAQAKGNRQQALMNLALLAFVALIVFLPLLRYSMEQPDMFGFRAFSRLGTVERPLPDTPVKIFSNNLGVAMAMFAWSDGNIWVHSVTGRPAVDVISGALFYLGMALLLLRYVRQWRWQDLFLVLAVPLLMMPSILSLAFPDENPALNRAGGAIVPVFLIVALALDGLATALSTRLKNPWGPRLAWALILFLVWRSAVANFDLVFNVYDRSFVANSWNTSEMGEVVAAFTREAGDIDHARVLAYPYWVDTRLVGINAGEVRDLAISAAEVANLPEDGKAWLFLVNLEDAEGVAALRQHFPQGALQRYTSHVEKDFYVFHVPPVDDPSLPAGKLDPFAPATPTP